MGSGNENALELELAKFPGCYDKQHKKEALVTNKRNGSKHLTQNPSVTIKVHNCKLSDNVQEK